MAYTYKFPRPAVTADCIVITRESEPKVLLIERGDEPFKGCWAFPGGFMNMDETTEQCAIRELEEERTYFLIDIPCHPYFSKKEIEIDTSGAKENVEIGVKDGVKGGVKELSDIQVVIVKEMLFDPSITTSEMAQKTGIKFRTLQRHISQLQAMGIVVRKDGRKDGYWEVVKNK